MSEMQAFISYPHRDQGLKRAWLEAFARALRNRNVKAWLDSDIKPGENWSEAVETALRESDAIIVVISSAASENRNLYFDLGVALGANKPVVLVTDPSSRTSIPFDLRRGQFVALRGPEETAHGVAQAIGALT